MGLVAATEKQIEEICKAIGTTPKQLTADVTIIKGWLSQQPHLPQGTGENLIKAFIIGCKNSLERAKRQLDNYYSVRGEFPELFMDRDPLKTDFQKTMVSKPFLVLPQLTEDGCRVYISTNADRNADNHDVTCWIQRALATLELKYLADPFCHGDYFIFDSRNFSGAHAAKITAHHIKSMIYCAEEVLPVRIKGIIFINTPSPIEFIVNKLLKPFLKKKIADRVCVYKEDHSALLQHFSPNILPKDYGGEEESIEYLNRCWMKKLETERDFLIEEGLKRSDESKRIKLSGKKSEKAFLDIEGTFRKLEID